MMKLDSSARRLGDDRCRFYKEMCVRVCECMLVYMRVRLHAVSVVLIGLVVFVGFTLR